MAPWLDRTNPHTIELHDPYLGALRSGQAHGGSRFGVLPSDDLAAAVADHGLAAATNLWLVQEFLQEVAGRAPQLRTVRITMRDLLRAPDVSLRPLLPAWTTEMSDTWGARGILISVTLDPRVHARRIGLQGAGEDIDFRIEWGLSYYADASGAELQPADDRPVKRTEVMVFLCRGLRSHPSVPDGADGGSDTQELACLPCPHAATWTAIALDSFRADLGEYARRHRWQAQLTHRRNEPVIVVSGRGGAACSAAAIEELRGIIAYYTSPRSCASMTSSSPPASLLCPH